MICAGTLRRSVTWLQQLIVGSETTPKGDRRALDEVILSFVADVSLVNYIEKSCSDDEIWTIFTTRQAWWGSGEGIGYGGTLIPPSRAAAGSLSVTYSFRFPVGSLAETRILISRDPLQSSATRV